MNDCVARIGVFHCEFHRHKHDREDELFYVLEGRLLLDLEGRSVELAPRQGMMVPRGLLHRTRAPERTVVLMIEAASVAPTGDCAPRGQSLGHPGALTDGLTLET